MEGVGIVLSGECGCTGYLELRPCGSCVAFQVGGCMVNGGEAGTVGVGYYPRTVLKTAAHGVAMGKADILIDPLMVLLMEDAGRLIRG